MCRITSESESIFKSFPNKLHFNSSCYNKNTKYFARAFVHLNWLIDVQMWTTPIYAFKEFSYEFLLRIIGVMCPVQRAAGKGREVFSN